MYKTRIGHRSDFIYDCCAATYSPDFSRLFTLHHVRKPAPRAGNNRRQRKVFVGAYLSVITVSLDEVPNLLTLDVCRSVMVGKDPATKLAISQDGRAGVIGDSQVRHSRSLSDQQTYPASPFHPHCPSPVCMTFELRVRLRGRGCPSE